MVKKIISFILRVLVFKLWELKYSKKLIQFKDIHKDEDCFIIGNGPSLNNMKLELLNDYYTFGLNKIHLIFSKNPFNLDYLVSVNPLVIKQSKKALNSLNVTKFISFISGFRWLKKSNALFYLGDILTPEERFYKKIEKGINQGYTVTYVAMQLAFYMGFKNVLLIGIDHNFKQEGNPNQTQKMMNDDPNHFDPNYFKGNNWQLADIENSEVSYVIAKYHFENDKRKIWDCTINGKLNIFDKMDFNEALKFAKKKKFFK